MVHIQPNNRAAIRSNHWSTAWIAAVALLAVFALSACTLTAPPVITENAAAQSADAAAGTLIEFDVAEDPTLFAFDDSHVFEDGMPAYGTAFISQGYIYPQGTLEGNEPGIHADGSPLYPDKVLGTWICKGWLIGDGLRTESGPVAVTTQIYQFNEAYDNAVIVSEGYELADIDVPVTRAVTGGAGEFVGARGEVQQTLLGMTDYFSVNLRLQVELQP